MRLEGRRIGDEAQHPPRHGLDRGANILGQRPVGGDARRVAGDIDRQEDRLAAHEHGLLDSRACDALREARRVAAVIG